MTLDGALLVLRITGRNTGRRYDIPVSYVDIDGHLIVITQHTGRVNARGGAEIEVTYGGHRQMMHADLDEDPTTATTLHRVIERIGWTAAQRQLGFKINVGRTPSLPEIGVGRARVQPDQSHPDRPPGKVTRGVPTTQRRSTPPTRSTGRSNPAALSNGPPDGQ